MSRDRTIRPGIGSAVPESEPRTRRTNCGRGNGLGAPDVRFSPSQAACRRRIGIAVGGDTSPRSKHRRIGALHAGFSTPRSVRSIPAAGVSEFRLLAHAQESMCIPASFYAHQNSTIVRRNEGLSWDHRRLAGDGDQAAGLGIGERVQQHLFHHAEHPGIGAEGERERAHRDQRETGIPALREGVRDGQSVLSSAQSSA